MKAKTHSSAVKHLFFYIFYSAVAPRLTFFARGWRQNGKYSAVAQWWSIRL